MINRWFLYIAINLIFISGCSNKTDSDPIDFNDNYLKRKSQFDSKHTNHFPLKLNDEVSIKFTESTDVTSRSLVLKSIINNIDSLEKSIAYFENNSKASYNDTDSCLIIVNRYLRYGKNGVVNTKNQELVRPKDCESDYYPVPKFWEINEPQDQFIHLDGSYTIYVIDAQEGIYYDSLDRLSGRDMPEDWRHGYSKGFASSRINQSIIYWVEVW